LSRHQTRHSALATQVSASGILSVQSGGSALGTIISFRGDVGEDDIASGSHQTGATLSGDDTVFSGGTEVAATVAPDGEETIYGLAVGAQVEGLGQEAAGVKYIDTGGEGAAAEFDLDAGNRASLEGGGPALRLHLDFAQSLRVSGSCLL